MASVDGGSRAEVEVSEVEPGHLIVAISGELDIQTVVRLDAKVDELLQRTARRVELDLFHLEFADSSGLAMLVRIANHFGPVQVLYETPLIRRIIEVTGLREVLQLDGEGQ